jgi:hypothetical protein
VRFKVFTAASLKFRFVFWDALPCKIIVDLRFRGTCCLHHQDGDGGCTSLLKVGRQLFYTAVHPRRQIWTRILLFSCRRDEITSLNFGHQYAYCLSPRLHMSVESHGVMTLTGRNRRTRRKACPSATLSIIYPAWTDPGANRVLRGERPETNSLSNGTALCNITFEA